MNKNTEQIGRYITKVLRHSPELIGLNIDQNGWAEVAELIIKMNEKGKPLTFMMLTEIVAINNRKRFAFNADQSKIRASQAHSIEIELGYTASIS